jgi:hypothetical protein
LNRGIRSLTKLAINLAEEIKLEGNTIKKHADDLYHLFWSKHGFEKTEAIELDMSDFINNVKSLEKITNEFCSDPVNVLTEKRFLIRKFYLGLGAQIQSYFEKAHLDCDRWLNVVIGELKTQINSHKKSLDKRAESLMESHNSADKLIKNLESTEKELSKLLLQSNELEAILLKLMRCAKFDTNKPSRSSLNAPNIVGDDIRKTAIFPNATDL